MSKSKSNLFIPEEIKSLKKISFQVLLNITTAKKGLNGQLKQKTSKPMEKYFNKNVNQ